MRLLALLATATVATSLQAQSPLPKDSLERVRRYSEWFFSGQIDSVWANVNERGRRAMSSPDVLTQRRSQFSQAAGTPIEVVEERFVWRGGARQYWRTIRATIAPELVMLRWVVGADGKIEGIGMNPVSQTPPADSTGPVIKP